MPMQPNPSAETSRLPSFRFCISPPTAVRSPSVSPQCAPELSLDLLDGAGHRDKLCYSMVDNLDGIAVFVAVAEAQGFRAAGERLGVTGSAVSQTLRRLEDRLGVTLVRRTTRSVRLTEAGERLYAAARPALAELRGAVAAVGELGDQPRGTVRLHVSSVADGFLAGPLLA